MLMLSISRARTPAPVRSLARLRVGDKCVRVHSAEQLSRLADRLCSPYAAQVYVSAGYTKADLIRDLGELARSLLDTK